MSIEKMYTLNDLVELLTIPKPTLRDKIRDGSLKARKIAGKWRVSESDVQAYIEGSPNNFDRKKA